MKNNNPWKMPDQFKFWAGRVVLLIPVLAYMIPSANMVMTNQQPNGITWLFVPGGIMFLIVLLIGGIGLLAMVGKYIFGNLVLYFWHGFDKKYL